ncbi:hypothetical protein OQA88_2682 [Cercophora sp. LCS_1]
MGHGKKSTVLAALLWGNASFCRGYGSNNARAESTRPADVWDTSIWDGLPPFPSTEPAEAEFGSVKLVLDTRPEGTPAIRVPNPCVDADFRPPVYEFADWKVTRVYGNASGEYPNTFHISVTLRDSLNKYEMECAGDHEIKVGGPYEDRFTRCAPPGGFQDDSFQPVVSFEIYQRTLVEGTKQTDWLATRALGFQQYWLCTPAANSSTYRRVYKAVAWSDFRISCPSRNGTETGQLLACNATTPTSLAADFTPAWSDLNQTDRLAPHPSPSPAPEKGMSPPAAVDCTDASFAHPDFIIEDGAVYVPSPRGEKFSEGASLNLTIANRATGVRNFCYWGGNHTALDWNTDMQLKCLALPGATADPTGSSFDLRFRTSTREAYFIQDWTCGDTAGTYSRPYRSLAYFTPPFYCVTGDGGVCRTNRYVARGQLQRPAQFDPLPVPPPPGADRVGCTTTSQSPKWVVHSFRFEEKRTLRTTYQTPAPPVSAWPGAPKNTLSLQLRNRANDYTVACQLDVANEDLAAKKWLRCFPDTGRAQHFIETYVQFDLPTAQLRINQTWYCNDTDPSRPLFFEGSGIARIRYCGEIQETQHDTCQQMLPRGCDYYSFTRWCSTGTWNNGQITPADMAVSGNVTRTVRMPATALTDPDPNPADWSCTVDSLGKPIEWTFKENRPEGVFHTTWLYMSDINEPKSFFAMDLVNSALMRRPGGGIMPHVDAWSKQLTPYTAAWKPTATYIQSDAPWWANGMGGKFPFDNLLGWKMRFDADKGYLELNHLWYCNDKNPTRPILFNGTWAGYLKMQCGLMNMTSPDRVDMACYLPGGAMVVKPKVEWRWLRSMDELPR